MSAVKHAWGSKAALTITSPEDDTVMVILPDSSDPSYAADRADFLAAVASELNVRIVPADAIVIERSELPAVVDEGGPTIRVERKPGVFVALNRVETELHGLGVAYIAAAEHLTTNPPVDEAQVDALNTVLLDEFASGVPIGDRSIARALVARGVRVVTS